MPVGMVFGNFQSEREELHHPGVIDLHEPVKFRGEYQRRRVAEIYKTKMSGGAYFAVEHGRDLTRIVIFVSSQRVSGRDRLRQPEIDLLEETGRRFTAMVEFRKHEGMKRVVDGRCDLG